MSKIAVIGKGKTGGEVLKLLAPGEEPIVFDQSHPVTVEKLKQIDVAIIFVPTHAVGSIFDVVLESGVPAVWGSTGFVWPADLSVKLKEHKTSWVIANNFSPMNVIIRKLFALIGQNAKLLENPICSIHEIHHIHKKDKPSGTAISWQEWLGLPCEITATREGDVKGIHELTIKTADETLTIHHEVHERCIFARGALWAARYLLEHPELNPGLYRFDQLEQT